MSTHHLSLAYIDQSVGWLVGWLVSFVHHLLHPHAHLRMLVTERLSTVATVMAPREERKLLPHQRTTHTYIHIIHNHFPHHHPHTQQRRAAEHLLAIVAVLVLLESGTRLDWYA